MSSDGTSSSTVKSYVDSAVGAAQSVVSSVTGNTADQVLTPPLHVSAHPSNHPQKQAEATKAQAEQEYRDSHTTAKLGPATVDPNTGAAVKNNEDRTAGSWNQTIGAAKESVGNFIGNENLRQAGIQQNADGKTQEASGQLSDLGQGITDRAQGALGNVGAAITGDRETQAKWQDVHDQGKARQRGVEADLQK
ncbi:putative mismatched base pair and cruciform DNA recognition protein [Talaromyces proteolyticus]|uniref:Mismatched base pair and cruciform DNA recognition protein n=1 Tax=Talaromyces proteolyticus TaxID=1131652 RepID=A0AAD4KQP4_9EURO|nr:putative mismatched base pair and cruciform DNA recognition protein [Talaromyces proteolyticus]KAH8694956.1 putative mismatched base pair and cruciform DNA recognition protein [Talaromyces proteolyticus]